MALVRPWVKSDLKGVLLYNSSRRLRGQMKKHVQCIEVDEEHNALKINDSETSVWCFVSKPGMENFNDGKNPKFASLNNKTITIEDWEFSTLSIVCPAFGERKAVPHCQICVLISKFVLFSGERTTTIGKPTELGEGDRDLRGTLRSLGSHKDLVRVLVVGQGLTDLRDIDGVLMSPPETPMVSGLSWSVVDPEILKSPAVLPSERDGAEPGATSDKRNQQQQSEPGAASAGGEHPPSSPGRKRPPPAVDAASRRVGASEKEASGKSIPPAGMSQHSPGMECDGDFGEEEDGFHTQAPSAGNVFGQEEMEMRPASPTPSPPPTKRGGGGNLGEGLRDPAVQQEQGSISDRVPLGGDQNTYEDAPLGHGDEIASEKGAAPRPGTEGEGGASAGRSIAARPRRPTATEGGGGEAEKMAGREGQEEEEEEEEENMEESAGSPVPAGLTQLDVVPPTWTASDRKGEVDEEEKEEEQDRIPSAPSAPTARSAEPASKGKGKGKGKSRGHTVGEVGGDSLRVSWHDSVSRLELENELAAGDEAARQDCGGGRESATAGPTAASVAGTGTASSQHADVAPASSPEDIVSPEFLSGGASSIGSPSSNQLGLRCLTQKRQGEGVLCHFDKGARAASRKCNIRSRFGGHHAAGIAARRGPSDNGGQQRTSRDGASGDKGAAGASGGGADGEEEEPSSSPDTVEMDVDEDDGATLVTPWNHPVGQKAAEHFPARPLRPSLPSERRWDLERPLSDVLVAVSTKWDGKGRPAIVARGHDADPSLAEWLDAKRPERPPPQTTVGEWLEKFRKEERKRQRLASSSRD